MTRRGLGRMITLWMYLSLGGSAIILAHSGAHGNFWALMASAAVCWWMLRALDNGQSGS